MATKITKLLAVAVLAGSTAFIGGPPVPKATDMHPAATQPAQESPEPKFHPPVPPKVGEPLPARPAEPQAALVPTPKARPVRKDQKKNQKKQASACDALRARLARTPTRVFSCDEMKVARGCERPGDRSKATAAQIAKGWQCWSEGKL